MTNARTIAAGLTRAQKRALLDAEVSEPVKWMKGYTGIKMEPCGMSANHVAELVSLGLVTLPIRAGDRSTTAFYQGEIHTLGLAVRAILQEQEHGE